MKLKLITDSGCDIAPRRAEELGILVLPYSYSFDGETSYFDGVDLTNAEFYEMERASSDVPKTAQISPLRFEETFDALLAQGYDEMIYFALSGSGSGTYQNAVNAARDFMEEHEGVAIDVVDSQSYAAPYGMAIVKVQEAVDGGASREEAIALFRRYMDAMHVFFVAGDLTHLKKGGRINAATLVLGNLLDIHPVLTIRDGLVVQDGKLRGSKNLWKKLVAIFGERGLDLAGKPCFIVHTCQAEKAEALRAEVQRVYPSANPELWEVGAVIGCHAGPELLGVGFYDL